MIFPSYIAKTCLNDRTEAFLATTSTCTTTGNAQTDLFTKHDGKAAGQSFAAEVTTTLTREASQSGMKPAEPRSMGQHNGSW